MHQVPTLNKTSSLDKNSKLNIPSLLNMFYFLQIVLWKLVVSHGECQDICYCATHIKELINKNLRYIKNIVKTRDLCYIFIYIHSMVPSKRILKVQNPIQILFPKTQICFYRCIFDIPYFLQNQEKIKICCWIHSFNKRSI